MDSSGLVQLVIVIFKIIKFTNRYSVNSIIIVSVDNCKNSINLKCIIVIIIIIIIIRIVSINIVKNIKR